HFRRKDRALDPALDESAVEQQGRSSLRCGDHGMRELLIVPCYVHERLPYAVVGPKLGSRSIWRVARAPLSSHCNHSSRFNSCHRNIIWFSTGLELSIARS